MVRVGVDENLAEELLTDFPKEVEIVRVPAQTLHNHRRRFLDPRLRTSRRRTDLSASPRRQGRAIDDGGRRLDHSLAPKRRHALRRPRPPRYLHIRMGPYSNPLLAKAVPLLPRRSTALRMDRPGIHLRRVHERRRPTGRSIRDPRRRPGRQNCSDHRLRLNWCSGRSPPDTIRSQNPAARPHRAQDTRGLPRSIGSASSCPRPTSSSLIVPLTAETQGMLGATEFALMKRGALLVNGARGPIVNTEALVETLQQNHLRAVLDVTNPEPLPLSHPLWSAPNCMITPHVAGSTPEFIHRAFRFGVRQVERFLAGEKLENVVNDAGY